MCIRDRVRVGHSGSGHGVVTARGLEPDPELLAVGGKQAVDVVRVEDQPDVFHAEVGLLTVLGDGDERPWVEPDRQRWRAGEDPVSYTHLRAHETVLDLVCRLLLEKKKKNKIH